MNAPAASAAHTPARPVGTQAAEGMQAAERHPPLDGSGDPQAIEHSIDATRDRLSRILEALQSKLSPAKMFDRGLHYLRDSGAELARSLGKRIQHEPVPVIVTAAGIALLVVVSGRVRRARRNASRAPELIGRIVQSADNGVDTLRRTAGVAGGGLTDASRTAGRWGREAHARLNRGIRRPGLLTLVVMAAGALLVALPAMRAKSVRTH